MAYLIFKALDFIQAPVIIDDEDEEDFQDPASLKAKRNGRAAGATSKRKRARIQDDSDGRFLILHI